jgi:hypothetical protein
VVMWFPVRNQNHYIRDIFSVILSP